MVGTLDDVISGSFLRLGGQATPHTVTALAQLLKALRAKLTDEPDTVAAVPAWFREQHGVASLWPGDVSVPALVCSNFVEDLIQLSLQAASDLSCTKVEPPALTAVILGDEDLAQLVDLCCAAEVPVFGLNARAAMLTPGVEVKGTELETCTDAPHKRVLTEEENQLVVAELEQGAESGRFIYVAGDRFGCIFVVMAREHAFSDAWDHFEHYLGRWHFINCLPRITVHAGGRVAKRVSMDSSRYGIGRPEPVAEGGLLRMLEVGGLFAVPIAFSDNHAIFLDVTMYAEEELHLFGVRMTEAAPIQDSDVFTDALFLEQLRLREPVSACLPSRAKVPILWLDDEMLAEADGPVALFNAFRRATEEDAAAVMPPFVAFAVPLDPTTALVLTSEAGSCKVHVVPRQHIE